MAKLSKTELAALDLIIAQMEEQGHTEGFSFPGAIVSSVTNAATSAVNAVANVATASANAVADVATNAVTNAATIATAAANNATNIVTALAGGDDYAAGTEEDLITSIAEAAAEAAAAALVVAAILVAEEGEPEKPVKTSVDATLETLIALRKANS